MPMISAAQWNLRLQNEYKAMCAFPVNSLFSWKLSPGQKPPLVHSYRVTYHVKTMIRENGDLKPQNTTVVEITMPDSPGAAPNARIVGGAIPFHPNIYTSGKFCLGDMWAKEPILWKLVINIGRVLAFDPARTNTSSPANPEANTSWKAMQAKVRKPYPCGCTNFPHPVGY